MTIVLVWKRPVPVVSFAWRGPEVGSAAVSVSSVPEAAAVAAIVGPPGPEGPAGPGLNIINLPLAP